MEIPVHMNKAPKDLANAVVAVTGGAGFIGSHLVARLLKADVKTVRIIDSFEYGDLHNLDFPAANVQVTSLRLGAGTREELVGHLDGVDFLFHVAAEKHNQSVDNPLKVIDANIAGTHELLAAAQESGVKKVVFTSSLYAYGRMSGPPFVETELPRPQTVYGLSKLAGEHLCSYFQTKFGLPYMSLRYLFVYGPKQFAQQGYKSVIVRNFERLLDGEPPVINGDGRQTLDYIFVDDVVELTLRAMVMPVAGEIVNICSGRGISVLALTELMQCVAQTAHAPVFSAPDPTHGSSRVGDPSRMHALLQYQPAVSIESGLRTTLAWMRLRRQAA
jgi:UDP-glucose 4-epimerase